MNNGVYSDSRSHFLFGRIYCGECGEQMRRITYGRDKSRRKVWKCHGRTKKNGCMNDVINEDDLFRELSKVQKVAWEGVDAMDADDFADVSRVLLYKDRIEVERE